MESSTDGYSSNMSDSFVKCHHSLIVIRLFMCVYVCYCGCALEFHLSWDVLHPNCCTNCMPKDENWKCSLNFSRINKQVDVQRKLRQLCSLNRNKNEHFSNFLPFLTWKRFYQKDIYIPITNTFHLLLVKMSVESASWKWHEKVTNWGGIKKPLKSQSKSQSQFIP